MTEQTYEYKQMWRHHLAAAIRAELIRQAEDRGAYIQIDQAGDVAFDGTIQIEALLDAINVTLNRG